MYRVVRLAWAAQLFALASAPLTEAQPLPGPGWGHVFIDRAPSPGPVSTFFAYSSKGDSVGTDFQVDLVGNRYTVFFEGVTEDTPLGFVTGMAHVSAYGKGYCTIGGWYPTYAWSPRGAGTEVIVHCFDDAAERS